MFTDPLEQMPEDVRRAEAQLAAVAKNRKRRGSDGRMGLVVKRGDPAWSAVENYAAWSINAELTGADDEDLATRLDDIDQHTRQRRWSDRPTVGIPAR